MQSYLPQKALPISSTMLLRVYLLGILRNIKVVRLSVPIIMLSKFILFPLIGHIDLGVASFVAG